MIDEMYRMIRWQCDKLMQLEKEISDLKQQIVSISTGKTNVEKIEYNFEQLKVENLNGVLHIGVSPGDDLKIEDMFQKEVHKAEDITMNETTRTPMFQDIQKDVYRYIRDEIPSILRDQSKTRNIGLSEGNITSIVQDIIKQSDARIHLLIQHARESDQKNGQEIHDHVVDRVKADILSALDRYIDHFREGKE